MNKYLFFDLNNRVSISRYTPIKYDLINIGLHNTGGLYYVYQRSKGHSLAPVRKSQTPFKHLQTNHLDAVFYSTQYKSTYFYSGQNYYRLNADMSVSIAIVL